MANYGGAGNQALNTAFKCDIVSDYHNKLLWNIFEGGVINNYTNVINCNSDGISTPETISTVIEWNNTEYGPIPLETNLYVKIELYRSNELFYLIDVKANNNGQYVWEFPTELDIAGLYKLRVTGLTDSSYYYEDKIWWIASPKDKFLKLRYPLSLFIKPNNADTKIEGIRLKYEQLTHTLDPREVAQRKQVNQLLKMDSTDNIILQVPDGYMDTDVYVIAEFNWIEDNDRNAVLFYFSLYEAENNQLNICKVHIDSIGEIDAIYTTDEGLLLEQTISTVSDLIDSYVNVDKLVNTYDAGNESGNIPINNGELNINLNTETVDGYEESSLGKTDGNLVENLNSEFLGNSEGSYRPGNEAMNIPISNKLLCEGLNAEFISGMSDVDLESMGHEHPLNDNNVVDGSIYKKLINVEIVTEGSEDRGQAINESFNDAAFHLNNVATDTFIRGGKLKIVTGSLEGDLTNVGGELHIGFQDNTFSEAPLIQLQAISDTSYKYLENVNLGKFVFMTDLYITDETYEYVTEAVELIIEDSTSGYFSLSVDDTAAKQITAKVTDTTTVQDMVDAINDKSNMITARVASNGDPEAIISQKTVDPEAPFITGGGYKLDEGTYIKQYVMNISQSGFVLHWEVYREDSGLADGKLYKQTGQQKIWTNWVAIGYAG